MISFMKKIILITLLLFVSCSISKLDSIDTTGLTYDGKNIFLDGSKIATLSAMEIAFDDGDIVREATFVLTSPKYNEYAIPIIKLVQESTKSNDNKDIRFEVEVELKNEY